jgi:thiamine biosynthesis protein ThiS
MQLTVNGKPHRHEGDGRLSALLRELGADERHAAVTVNGEIVPRARRAAHRLREGDVVEVLVFAAGG